MSPITRFARALAPPLPHVRSAMAYPLGVLLPIAAALIQRPFLPQPSIAPFVVFYFAVTVVASLGGRGPGLVAVFVSALLANYYFIAPFDAFNLSGSGLVATALFIVTASAIAVLCGSLRTAMDALRESEARLSRAQEIAHLGSWELDLERNRLTWSDEVFRIFGLEPQQFGATYEAFLQAVHPDDRARVDAAYSSSLKDGRDTYEIEHRIVRRSSGEIRTVHEKCQHSRDRFGKVVLSVGMVHDITERKRVELEAVRSLDRLARLVQSSVRVVREMTLEGLSQVIADAARELTGAQIAITGHGYMSGRFQIGATSRAPDAPSCPENEVFRIERGGVSVELVNGKDAVRLTDAELRSHPLWWGLPEGHAPLRGLLGVRLAARDGRTNGLILVTDKVQGDFTAEDESLLRQLGTLASLALQHIEARAELVDTDRRKNEFMAVLSHELRNPLAPIKNSLYILDRATPGGEQARRAKTIIDRQVDHLNRLVDDLLDVTRISRGKIQLQREPLDLAQLVARVVEDHRSVFAASGVELEVAIGQEDLWMEGDRVRLSQAVGNLLQNTAKFTARGGQAVISVRKKESLAVVSVRDTGVGISPEVLAHLFEPFVQAEATLDRSRGGLGLGLALVRGLVELHGGAVEAQSAGLGQGAEFTLRLPLAARADVGAHNAGQTTARSRRRVLVIEDNVDAASSLREALELGNHEVEVAYDGLEGIGKAREFGPDVVLCDIGLPGMDGYEVARALRCDEALRSIRLVAVSGYALPEDLAKAREAGFDRHVAKPLSPDKLEEILGSMRS